MTGSIYLRESKDLNSWKKETLILKPKLDCKFNSYVSPSLINFQGKKMLFVEAQTINKSRLKCFEIKSSKEVIEKTLLINYKGSLKSPYAFKFKENLYLFFSYKNIEIKCIVYNRNFGILKSFSCLKTSHRKIIYSPAILKLKKIFLMFYADWENNNKGNISVAISKDLENWKILKKNIFSTNKNVKIISEPFVIIYNKKVIIFFEFKRGKKWNLSKYSISVKSFLDFLTTSDKI